MGRKKKNTRSTNTMLISEPRIRWAIKHTLSCAEAARFLHITYNTFKKIASRYIDAETGKTLFEIHKNQHGLGIRQKRLTNKTLVRKILDGELTSVYNANEIRDGIIVDGILPECCGHCKFAERRLVDGRVPLVLNWKDKNRRNNTLENWELLCYNCYFLFVGDFLNRRDLNYDWDNDRWQDDANYDISMGNYDASVFSERD